MPMLPASNAHLRIAAYTMLRSSGRYWVRLLIDWIINTANIFSLGSTQKEVPAAPLYA